MTNESNRPPSGPDVPPLPLGAAIAARVGWTLYLAACTLAVLVAGYASLLAFHRERDTMLLAVFFAIAFGIWLVGRLIFRVFTGR
jgi:hypothetical protein